LLEEYHDVFNNPSFIQNDPVRIPHLFSKPEDIEISGFLTSAIAWGQRNVIIRNALNLVESMPGGPHEFLLQADDQEIEYFSQFKHRTFNGIDCRFFLNSLKNIYINHGGLKSVFEEGYNFTGNIPGAINHFRNIFFSIEFPRRTLKHIPDINRNAAAKRLNLFLRWMVRKDDRGVDFGLWDIPASALYIPLDVHTSGAARELGLLSRKQDDWKAVRELTYALRNFDPTDPVKFDFALFGISTLGKLKEIKSAGHQGKRYL
jgi:uncharacterized protein (TIGR02757 family)